MVNPVSNNSEQEAHQIPHSGTQQTTISTHDNTTEVAQERLGAPTSLTPATSLTNRTVKDNVSDTSAKINELFTGKSIDQLLKSLELSAKKFRSIKDLDESEAVKLLKEAFDLFEEIKNNHLTTINVKASTPKQGDLALKEKNDGIDSCIYKDQMAAERGLDQFRFALALGLSELKEDEGHQIRSYIKQTNLHSSLANILELSDCLAEFPKRIDLARVKHFKKILKLGFVYNFFVQGKSESELINNMHINFISKYPSELIEQGKVSLAFDLITALSIDDLYWEGSVLLGQQTESDDLSNDNVEVVDNNDLFGFNKAIKRKHVCLNAFVMSVSELTVESDFITVFQSAMISLRFGDILPFVNAVDRYIRIKEHRCVMECAKEITHPYFYDQFILNAALVCLVTGKDVTKSAGLFEHVSGIKVSDEELSHNFSAEQVNDILSGEGCLGNDKMESLEEALITLLFRDKYDIGLKFCIALTQPEVKIKYIEIFALAFAIHGNYEIAIEGAHQIPCPETRSRVLDQIREEKDRMQAYKKISALISDGQIDEADKLCLEELSNLENKYGQSDEHSYYIMRMKNHFLSPFPQQLRSLTELGVGHSDLADLMSSRSELDVHTILNSKARTVFFDKKYTFLEFIGKELFSNESDVTFDEILLKLSTLDQKELDKHLLNMSISTETRVRILVALGARPSQGEYTDYNELDEAISGDSLDALNLMAEWLKAEFEKCSNRKKQLQIINCLEKSILYAVQCNKLDSLRVLIDNLLDAPFTKVKAEKLLSALLGSRDNRGYPVLLIAVNKNPEIAELLIETAVNHPVFNGVNPKWIMEMLFLKNAADERALSRAYGSSSKDNKSAMKIVQAFIKACRSDKFSSIDKKELFYWFRIDDGLIKIMHYENVNIFSDLIDLLAGSTFNQLDLEMKIATYTKQKERTFLNAFKGIKTVDESCLAFAANRGRTDLIEKMVDSIFADRSVNQTLIEKIQMFLNKVSTDDIMLMKHKGFDLISYLDQRTPDEGFDFISYFEQRVTVEGFEKLPFHP